MDIQNNKEIMKNEIIKKIDLRILLLISLLIIFYSIIINYLIKINFFEPLIIGTYYLIQPELISGLIWIVIFSILIFYVGKLKIKDLLLDRKRIKLGLKWTLILWIITNLFSIIYLIITKDELKITDSINVSIGEFIGQLFGNAALEEMLFRGLFFIQFYLLFGQKVNNKFAIILAILVSQVFWSVVHIPNRLLNRQIEHLILELIRLFIYGVILTIIFIKTKNLILLVGAHSLLNVPFNLIEIDFPLPIVVLMLIVIISLFWNILENEEKRSFFNVGLITEKKAQNANTR
ncbi:MAG: hypothetical protein A2W91_00180 [Bacteroidetes bacterium GWF2_38_335]|nr:MAG: hypothetical protein A2W91_00180 [Bacteroidetes bacterium GWF2_38_335]OFY78251.1 MAG: hypothetical protein A2281_03560 [Bacteroidetes bacterium RIFOXYA12_FULL_38_20]HBS87556.1 hypothetical protein [Bacteroidales bacterium]